MVVKIRNAKLNLALYYWRRNDWILSPSLLRPSGPNVRIDRPIFLLGNQGDGLTFVSRILRRNIQIVTVSGGHDYWSGADEMATVFEPILTPRLRLAGRLTKTDPYHVRYTQPRSWSYACDDLIDQYHLTEGDATERDRKALKRVIRVSLARFGQGDARRYLDKSQVYTVRARFIQELLAECDPHFVLVTRNPYATCYRAAKGKAGDMARYSKFMDFDARLDICIQHWDNAMRTILADAASLRHFAVFRFEDFLTHTRETTIRLCEFLDLPFDADMVPSEGQELPFGTKYRTRWYPVNANVNERYLQAITPAEVNRIHQRCGTLAEQFGYGRPT